MLPAVVWSHVLGNLHHLTITTGTPKADIASFTSGVSITHFGAGPLKSVSHHSKEEVQAGM